MQQTAAYGHFGRNNPDFTWEILVATLMRLRLLSNSER